MNYRKIYMILLLLIVCYRISAQDDVQNIKSDTTYTYIELVPDYIPNPNTGELIIGQIFKIGYDSISTEINKDNYYKYLLNHNNYISIDLYIDKNSTVDFIQSIVRFQSNNTNLTELKITIDYNFDFNKILEEIDFSKLKHLEGLEILNYSNKELFIPSSVYKISKLKSLIIEDSHLTSISKDIGNLKELEVINLFNNDLVNLPIEFGELENLKVLNLNTNIIKEIPVCIYRLNSLERLNFGNNGLNVINAALYDLDNLTHLIFSSTYDYRIKKLNKINMLPEGISKLSKLKSLDLAGNPIQNLPNDFNKLENLEYLNIGSSNITDFTQKYKLPKLDTLILESTKTDSITDKIIGYTDLKYLDLSKSYLVYVSQNISNLKKLKVFNVEDVPISLNQIKNVLPKHTIVNYSEKKEDDFEFAEKYPTYVKSLRLSFHDIKNMGDEILTFINLKRLVIANVGSSDKISFVASIDMEQVFNNLSQLDSLREFRYYYFDTQNRDYVTDFSGLSNLTNLEMLDISDLHLKEFPQEICELKKLKKLNLEFNNFTKIPEGLSNLSELKYIDLRRNCINEFPKAILKLKNIEYIDLMNNDIHQLPSELINLKKLDKLYLNNIRHIDGYDVTCLNKIDTIPNNLKAFVEENIITFDK